MGAQAQVSACFRARGCVALDSVPDRAVLRIAAESIYRLYVNGVPVGRGPVRGTHRVNYFDSYDIAPYLSAGDNWIAVAVHCPNRATFKYSPARPGVLVQCDALHLATDTDWQVQPAPDHRADVPLFTYQIGRMEWYDRRAEPIGWQTGRDGSAWEVPVAFAAAQSLADKALHARDIPALQLIHHAVVDVSAIAHVPTWVDLNSTAVAQQMTDEPHLPIALNTATLLQASGAPLRIDPPADGGGVALVFDFACSVNGGFALDIDAPAGTVVDAGFEEEMAGQRLTVKTAEYDFADRYILRAGRQRVGTEFAERGFRYLQIVLRNFTQPIYLHTVSAYSELYPYVDRGSFASSDALLNQLWQLSNATLRACTTDTFVDCPWRENTCYLNDIVVEAVTSLQAFGDGRIVDRCMRLAASQVREEDGLFPGAVPYGLAGAMTAQQSRDRMTLTGGNLTVPLILEDYLLYTGDRSLVRDLMDPVLRMLATFESWETSAGFAKPPIAIWNFIDWSLPTHMAGRVTAALEWLRVLALDATARLMQWVDPANDVSALRHKAARLADSIDEHFWNEDSQCYHEGIQRSAGQPMMAQLTQALALLSGRAPEHRRPALAAALDRDDLVPPELFMHHFVFRAMAAAGQAQAIRRRIERYWAPIAQSGSPTIWELNVCMFGKSGFDNVGSLCHGFSTSPVDFMQRVVLGVIPTAPGFSQCRFDLHTAGLASAGGRVPTPFGAIHVRWHRQGNDLLADVVVPPGVEMVTRDGQPLQTGQHRLIRTAEPQASSIAQGELVVL